MDGLMPIFRLMTTTYVSPGQICLFSLQMSILSDISLLVSHRYLTLNMFRTEFISFSYASSCNFSVLVTGTTVSQVQTPKTWALSNVSPPFVRPQPPSDKPSSSVKRVSEVVYEFIYSLCPYCFHFTFILNYVLNLLVLNYCMITSQWKVTGGGGETETTRPRGNGTCWKQGPEAEECHRVWLGVSCGQLQHVQLFESYRLRKLSTQNSSVVGQYQLWF